MTWPPRSMVIVIPDFTPLESVKIFGVSQLKRVAETNPPDIVSSVSFPLS